MRSLSPHFDSTPPTESLPGMTNLSEINEPTEPDPEPTNSLTDGTKGCDWKYDSDVCGCKSVCGCKYINKVSPHLIPLSQVNDVFLSRMEIRDGSRKESSLK